MSNHSKQSKNNKNKCRADELLVEHSWVETRSKAQALIMAGHVEYYHLQKAMWQKVQKAGEALLLDTEFRVLDPHSQDVGRGAKKLRGALDNFGLRPEGVGLDIGSSTGGFTQVLLEKRAEKACERVLALDVGTHQLHERLRADPRVLSVENQHVLHVDDAFWQTCELKPPFDCMVCDLSFISLTRVIDHVWPWLKSGGWWVLLVKPQFELDAKKVPGGIVKEQAYRDLAIENVLSALRVHPDLMYKRLMESPIRGGQGNLEYLMWVQKK